MKLELLTQVILASSDSGDGDGRMLGLIFFLSGFVFYGLMVVRYRNADKRHHHEKETEAQILDVRAHDRHIDTKKGVKNARMTGANNHEVRGALAQGNATGLAKPVEGIVQKLPGSWK